MFDAPGEYSVTLEVSSATGSDALTRYDYITVERARIRPVFR